MGLVNNYVFGEVALQGIKRILLNFLFENIIISLVCYFTINNEGHDDKD